MRTLVILFILLCFNFNNCIAQKRKNYSLLGISIGMHYTKVFNPERAVYHPEYCSINVDCTSNVSFKAQSRSGYQFGVNYKYISTRNFFMNAGLAYYRRHFNSEGIKDSVIKYSMSTSPYYIADHYSRTIEGVLAAGYTFKKIAVKLGYNIKLMERSVLKKTFLDESTDQREVSYSSSYNEKYFRPTLGIEYNFKRPGSRVYFIPEFTVQRLAKKYYTFLFNLNVMLKTYRR